MSSDVFSADCCVWFKPTPKLEILVKFEVNVAASIFSVNLNRKNNFRQGQVLEHNLETFVQIFTFCQFRQPNPEKRSEKLEFLCFRFFKSPTEIVSISLQKNEVIFFHIGFIDKIILTDYYGNGYIFLSSTICKD